MMPADSPLYTQEQDQVIDLYQKPMLSWTQPLERVRRTSSWDD